MIQFDLGLLELDVDVSLNRYLKEKTKTEKAFSPIDCAINGKITIFLWLPDYCLPAWRLTYFWKHDYFTCPKSNNGQLKIIN